MVDDSMEEFVLMDVQEDEFTRRKAQTRREAYQDEEEGGRPHMRQGVQCASQ